MLDWFAARPPRSEQPPRDRPSIPLTAGERAEFDALSRQLDGRGGAVSALSGASRWVRQLGTLPVGALLVVAGAVWCIAWLSTNVVVSFAGVIAQAAGLRLVIDFLRVRTERSAAAAPPEASRQQTSGQRRRGL